MEAIQKSASVLSRNALSELARRAREENDADAREQLILHNMRFVTYIAEQYRGRGVDRDDLLQEGMLGLVIAADKFDERKGFIFITYAEYWIRNRMQRALSSANVVRPAEWVREKARVMAKIARGFMNENGRPATIADIATITGEDEARVAKILRLNMVRMRSLDAKMGRESDQRLYDILYDTAFNPFDVTLVRQLLSQCRGRLRAFWKEICGLPNMRSRNAEIFFRYYGMDGSDPHETEYALANVYGLCHERIRQIKKSVWKRFHKAHAGNGDAESWLREEVRCLKALARLAGETPWSSEE